MSDDLTSPGAESTAPTPSATPAAATPAAPVAQPTTPAASQPPATGGEAMVPSYRLRETREAAIRESQSQWAQKEAQYQAQLTAIQRQLHALVGVNPQAQNTEVDAIKQQFGQVYPGLSQLEQRAQDLMQLIDRAGDLEQQNDHYWRAYGRQTMNTLYEKASSSLGAPLTEEGKRHLLASFAGFVQSSPELVQRYEQDPTIVEDFWNAFSSSFIDPARRAAASSLATRAAGVPTPQDTPSGAPQAQPAPKFGGMDERVAAAWAQYQAGKKT